MNKSINILILLPLIISGCKYQFEDKYIIQSIDSFNMDIYSNEGNKTFSIKSPISNYDRKNNIINLKDTTIYLFKDDQPEYVINSDKSKLSNNNKLVELNGNVSIKTLNEDNDILKANSFKWNINNSEYLLIGNVYFENNKITLNSNKAILHKNTNIIEFFNPVKYVIKNNNNKNIYEINSENATYNINTKTVSFKSYEKRVRSNFYF